MAKKFGPKKVYKIDPTTNILSKISIRFSSILRTQKTLKTMGVATFFYALPSDEIEGANLLIFSP